MPRTSQPAPSDASRAERVLAYMFAATLGLSILAILVTLILAGFGIGAPAIVALLPMAGLPIAIGLLIALVVVGARRRKRDARNGGTGRNAKDARR